MRFNLLKQVLLFGLLLFSIDIVAQTVSGTVSDSDGPLPGATVIEKGTNNVSLASWGTLHKKCQFLDNQILTSL